jgi:APA family basic amino acid/polyamine antiporter
MLVAGSMIGSGVFIVSADIARHVGSTGWLLLAWVVTGALTLAAALSYGELAAMMPRAGGQYVYLREAYNPLCGFLFGWTSFLVIQSGTIAAVGVAFSRYFGVVVPAVSPTSWIIPPINISTNYALSLSTQQGVAILVISLLTFLNTRGLQLGKWIQNVFTSAKMLALLALILLGLVLARDPDVMRENFSNLWTPRNVDPVKPDLGFLATVSATAGVFGLLVAFCVAQVGSLFSSDAWNNITFTAGEVRNPKRNLPLALALGTGIVTLFYLLANLAYLGLLPLEAIKTAPDDRVATAAMETVFHGAGPLIMAVAIMVSTFGCNNGIILSGARVYYAMAKDGVFFRRTGELNRFHVPAAGLVLQCVWTCLLVLPRIRLRDPVTGAPKLDPVTGVEMYGNLYSKLLDYVVFAVLIFYILTIIGIFILRRRQPGAERPYKAFGYPLIPLLYILIASVILVVLLFYRTETSWPGLAIVLAGVPVYFFWKQRPPSGT